MATAWAPNGRFVAVATDLGELEVCTAEGGLVWRSQVNGAAALVFDSEGNLYAGDWSGLLRKYQGDNGKVLWQTDLGQVRTAAPALPDSAYAEPPQVPLVAYQPVVPADPRPAGHNVALSAEGAKIKLCGKGGWGFTGHVAIDPGLLIDGKTQSLPRTWQDIDEVWSSLTFGVPPQAEITLPKPARITGLIIHETAAHPEAFARFVFIDALVKGHWQRVWSGPVAPALIHDHVFRTPVMATAIRYIPAACALNGVYTSQIEVMALPNAPESKQ